MNKEARLRGQIKAAEFIQEYLSNKRCADCGETDINVLTFDHVRGEKYDQR